MKCPDCNAVDSLMIEVESTELLDFQGFDEIDGSLDIDWNAAIEQTSGTVTAVHCNECKVQWTEEQFMLRCKPGSKTFHFPVTLAGTGDNPEDAWNDAVGGFGIDSGSFETYEIDEVCDTNIENITKG